MPKNNKAGPGGAPDLAPVSVSDADDDVVDLLEVVKPGKPLAKASAEDVDFSADLESMLDTLSAAEKAHDEEAQTEASEAFPDPTPVDHIVDPDESLDMPDMDDLDAILDSLGASAPPPPDMELSDDVHDMDENSAMPDLDALPAAAPATAKSTDAMDADYLDTLLEDTEPAPPAAKAKPAPAKDSAKTPPAPSEEDALDLLGDLGLDMDEDAPAAIPAAAQPKPGAAKAAAKATPAAPAVSDEDALDLLDDLGFGVNENMSDGAPAAIGEDLDDLPDLLSDPIPSPDLSGPSSEPDLFEDDLLADAPLLPDASVDFTEDGTLDDPLLSGTDDDAMDQAADDLFAAIDAAPASTKRPAELPPGVTEDDLLQPSGDEDILADGISADLPEEPLEDEPLPDFSVETPADDILSEFSGDAPDAIPAVPPTGAPAGDILADPGSDFPELSDSGEGLPDDELDLSAEPGDMPGPALESSGDPLDGVMDISLGEDLDAELDDASDLDLDAALDAALTEEAPAAQADTAPSLPDDDLADSLDTAAGDIASEALDMAGTESAADAAAMEDDFLNEANQPDLNMQPEDLPEPAPVAHLTPPSPAPEKEEAASAQDAAPGSRFDEVDLNELDALLDDMLATAPAPGPAPAIQAETPAQGTSVPEAAVAVNGNNQSVVPSDSAFQSMVSELAAMRLEINSLKEQLDAAASGSEDRAKVSLADVASTLDSQASALSAQAAKLEDLELTIIAEQNARTQEREAPATNGLTDKVQYMEGQILALDTKSEEDDARAAGQESRLQDLDARLSGMDDRLAQMEHRFEEFTANIDKAAAEAAARIIREEIVALMTEAGV